MISRSPQITHPRTVSSHYLLSGFIFCSCGYAMIGHSAKSNRYHYYVCSRSCKQGREACNTNMISKKKIERLVLQQLQSNVLTDDNLEKLVVMVNEEIQSSTSGIKQRLDVIKIEQDDIRVRLSKLYDALETGKLQLDDLAPRIKKLRSRQEEFNRSRIQVEAEMVVQGVQQINKAKVKVYAQDMRKLLEEVEFTEKKAFLRSFIKRIVVNKEKVTIQYNLPLPIQGKLNTKKEVLSIGTYGRP